MLTATRRPATSYRGVASFNGRVVAIPPSLVDSNIPSLPSFAVAADLSRHISPSPRAIGTLTTDEMRCELVQFANSARAEMKFSLASYLIILLPDGISGGCEWDTDEGAGRSSSLPPNTIIFNPAHEHLRLRAGAQQACCRALLLTIASEAMDRLSGGGADGTSVKLARCIGMDDEDVRRTLLALVQEMECPGWNSKFYSETLLTLLLSQLIRGAANPTKPKPIPYRKGGLSSWRLKRALELLQADPCRAPSLAEVADQLRLHPSSLCRAFKQSTGLSPHQYLLSHRINCAKEMMRDDGRSLTQIALDCGFGDSSQFSVTFKRIVGMSPREYRRSL